jgi:hypothetical protein
LKSRAPRRTPPRAHAVFAWALALAVVAALLAGRTPSARADDYVAVRGAYYREPSTRVIQPVVELQKEAPNGFTVSAHFLVDTITSASAAAGTAVDTIFTEVRSEAGFGLAKRWQSVDASLGYRYSAESDYWSHGFGGALAFRFWGDTSRLAFSGGASFDNAIKTGPLRCPVAPQTCSLQAYFGGVTFSQVVSPVLFLQGSLETAYLDGFQGNLYRAVPGLGVERVPEQRLRNAFTLRGAYYLPRSKTGFQLQGRLYYDRQTLTETGPWGLVGYMAEARVFQTLTRDLEVRLSYRQYLQPDGAAFWCDVVTRPGCYGVGPTFFTADVKLGSVFTEYPEAKLFWNATAFAGTPFLSWFSSGTFEISYGYYIQSTAFGNAHVLQMGYRMPY